MTTTTKRKEKISRPLNKNTQTVLFATTPGQKVLDSSDSQEDETKNRNRLLNKCRTFVGSKRGTAKARPQALMTRERKKIVFDTAGTN